MSKSVAGITAGELIKNKIIQEARKLLSTTDASFKEIAFKLGFEDPAYFSRYFKKNTSQAMREFRMHLRELSK